MLIDSHCHLDCLDLDAYDGSMDKLVQATFDAGVQKLLTIAVDTKTSILAPQIAQQYDNVYASIGIHPHDGANELLTVAELVELSKQDKVVAIGETGLDYYYNSDGLDLQQESFKRHIQAAIEVQKPLVIHTRAAQQDTMDIMRHEHAEKCGGVMHCFTESWEMAKEALDFGFYVSISGIVTFKKATEVQEMAKKIPLDRLLIETDSPYLAPVPMRGKQNQPMYVKYVAEFLAQLRGESYQQLVEATGNNFCQLFLK